MSHRHFDPTQRAPAFASAAGIEWTMRGGSLSLSTMRFVVATKSLA